MKITLLDMLLNAGLINRDQFEDALKHRVLYGGKIGTSLIELGYVSEETLARFLSSKLAVPYVPPQLLLNIPQEIIDLIPRELAVKYRVIPLKLEKKRLNLVMADPADLKAIDEIGFITGFIIRPLVTPEVRFAQAFGRYYQGGMDPRYQHLFEMLEARRQEEEANKARVYELTDADMVPVELPPAIEIPDIEPERIELAEDTVIADWPDHIRRLEPDAISLALAYAEKGEDIVDNLVAGLGRKLPRVALFRIKGGRAIGWKGIDRQKPLPGLAGLSLPLNEPSALQTVTTSAGYYLGPLQDTPVNHVLLDAVGGGAPGAVLLLPLFVSGRLVNILYVESDDDLSTIVPELHKILGKAAMAFEMLIFRDKILML